MFLNMNNIFHLIFSFYLGRKHRKLRSSLTTLIFGYFVFFGLIVIAETAKSRADVAAAYEKFDQLVTEFSKKNCPFNVKHFNVLEAYYSAELKVPSTPKNCTFQQIPCIQCKPCMPCICEYVPSTQDQEVMIFYSNILMCFSNFHQSENMLLIDQVVDHT